MDDAQSTLPSTTDSSTILVVEDNEAQRELVKTVLESGGYTVLAAEDLSEARAALTERPVSLVLCDIYLRGQTSGTELLRELAPRSPDTAVVMVTGATDTQTAINCLREGAFDYLLKPYTPKDLTHVVQGSLERREKQISARQEMHKQIEMLAKFASESPDPVLRVDPEGQIIYANQAALPLIEKWSARGHNPVPASLEKVIAEACHSGTKQQLEIFENDKAYSFTVAPIRGSAFAYLYGHDITDRLKAERELIKLRDQAEWMALHDPLTALPNRKHFEQRLLETVERCSGSEEKMAAVFLDLDNFKYINDLYGHKTGDRALLFVAEFFKTAQAEGTLTTHDTIGRWGGDELVVLMTGITSHADARNRCKGLQERLHAEVSAKLQFPLASSMGIAVFPNDATEPGELLQQADTALYIAKSR
ncbi:MAG: diguanylate cyclase domain-containing protein, partial [Opitutales bacterium]